MTDQEIMNEFCNLYNPILCTKDFSPVSYDIFDKRSAFTFGINKGNGICIELENGDKILYFPGKRTVINSIGKKIAGSNFSVDTIKKFLNEFDDLDELKEFLNS